MQLNFVCIHGKHDILKSQCGHFQHERTWCWGVQNLMEATGVQNTCCFNEGVSKRSSVSIQSCGSWWLVCKIFCCSSLFFFAVGRSSVWPFVSTLDGSTATKRNCAVMFAAAILYSWNPLGVEFHLTHESTTVCDYFKTSRKKMVLFSSYARDVYLVYLVTLGRFGQGSCHSQGRQHHSPGFAWQPPKCCLWLETHQGRQLRRFGALKKIHLDW